MRVAFARESPTTKACRIRDPVGLASRPITHSQTHDSPTHCVNDQQPYWHVAARRRLEHVSAFCERVSPGQEPVPVRSQPLMPGVPNECFSNVTRHVRRFGGDVLHGWAIWEIPQMMIEAEFHAVWRDRSGALLDVNPRRERETRITFLPAPTIRYPGNAIDNIREALIDDVRVHAFVAKARRRYELLKDYPPGLISFPIEVYTRAFPNADKIDSDFFLLAIERRALTDPCLCGSRLRFADCHASEFGR